MNSCKRDCLLNTLVKIEKLAANPEVIPENACHCGYTRRPIWCLWWELFDSTLDLMSLQILGIFFRFRTSVRKGAIFEKKYIIIE